LLISLHSQFVARVISDGSVGVDISGGDLVQVSASSSTACAQQCDGNSGCKGWSWDSCGRVNCWLKSAVGTRSSNNCRVSDARQGEAGFDRPGYDMPGMPLNLGTGATASTCAYRCINTTGCVAWSWTGVCYLKWWAPAATTGSPSLYSGVQGVVGRDYPGIGDLSSSTLTNNESSTTCAKLCESTAGCYAWSFAVASAACPTIANTCWLKSFVAGQSITSVPINIHSCRTAGLASRFYDTSSPRVGVKVTSVVGVGNQTDQSLYPIYPTRDGGAVGTLADKIVWFWSDTTYSNANNNNSFAGFYGNTEALGTPTNQLVMKGPERQAIPFTTDELAFNNKYSYNPRVVLWPKSGVIETSPGNGLLWVPKGYYGKTITDPEPNAGIVLSSVTIGTDGNPVVTRLSDVPLFPLNSVPSYGSVSAVTDNNYVYLYSTDSFATFGATTMVARAPLAGATSLSSYQYWNAGASKWEGAAPNIANTSYAIFTSTFGVDGNVYYSSYHRAWIFIYSNHADYHVYLRTAPAPQGPWSAAELIYSPPPSPQVSYIYGTTGTNVYDTTGQSASIDFTWCYPNTYANWVAQVSFV